MDEREGGTGLATKAEDQTLQGSKKSTSSKFASDARKIVETQENHSETDVDQSDIQCIFYSQFDPNVGPVIRFQYPPKFITDFDKIHQFIITKDELVNFVLTVDVNGRKYMGCCQSVRDVIYPRNYLLFNFCFVLNGKCQRLSTYEGIVKKLGHYFYALEKENNFLSSEQCSLLETKILKVIMDDLNQHGRCVYAVGPSTVLYLKTTEDLTSGSDIADYEVPILLPEWKPSAVDLTLRQILPFIDGQSHVSRIALLADVDVKLVKACLQNLLFFKAIKVIPVFLYSASYACKSRVQKLITDSTLRQLCAETLHPAKVGDVYRFYCALGPGIRVRDIINRFPQITNVIEISKVVNFGIIQSLIRRVRLYPVRTSPSRLQTENLQSTDANGGELERLLENYMDGAHSLDEIACDLGISVNDIEDQIDRDEGVTVLWR